MKVSFKRLVVGLLVLSMFVFVAACSSNTGSTETQSPQAPATEAPATEAPTSTPDAATPAPSVKADPVTLTMGLPAVWVDYGGFKDIIAKWEADTGNKIEVQAVDDKQFDQLLQAKLSAGEPWDLFARYSGQSFYKKINADQNTVDLSNESWVPRINDGMKSNLTYNGKIYASPFDGAGVIGIMYNKTVFAKLNLNVPKTPAEFETVLDTIKKAGITPIYMAAKDGWPVSQIINVEGPNIWKGAGDDIINQLNANKVRWDGIPAFVNIIKRYEGYVKKGYFNKDMATATYDMSLKAIADGTAAMTLQGNWVDDAMSKTYPNAQYAMFPAPSDDGNPFIATSASNAIYISSKSKNIEAAKSFLAYLNSVEVQNGFFDKKPGIPVFKDVTVSKVSPSFSETLPLIQAGQSSIQFTNDYVVPYGGDWEAMLQQLLLGSKTADQFTKAWSDYMIKAAKQLNTPGF